jgi:hypothetical protein
MNWYEFIIELLKAFISWPFVVGVVLIYVFWNYKKPIEDWLRYSPKRGSLAGVGTFESGPIAQEVGKPEITPEGRVTKELLGLLDKSKEEAQYWYKQWWFERTWVVIFRSQIEILEHLSNQKDKPATLNYLFNFYANAARVSPILLNYSYKDYMEFLELSNLVRLEVKGKDLMNPDVVITPLGDEFLIYLKSAGYNKNV